ncbi:hypothetical protein C2G38_737233 [Gigaspora rosea]|uniref:Uncharacterized protein n=1 Tax=Gigaspora rosea TaxID=44941 RepID=A0A397VVN9_9GLOM|nr:hypothetical protein C2G38_737233 [Gigaspora rosea]
MATWLDGIRTIKTETRNIDMEKWNFHFPGWDGMGKGQTISGQKILTEFKQSRIKPCGVNLIISHGSQTSDFIEKLTNYQHSDNLNNILYGITQNEVTGQYIMVIADKFNAIREGSKGKYGKCTYCGHNNTSPAWCQSCDPWKTIQGPKSGDERIDKLIKKYQIIATNYEVVIEWIPFNKLIDLHEIEEYKPQETNEESN